MPKQSVRKAAAGKRQRKGKSGESRKSRLPAAGARLRSRLLKLMRAEKYQPLDLRGFAKKLGVERDELDDFNLLLHRLEREGEIARVRKNRYIIPEAADLVTGTIRIHPKGFGHIASDELSEAGVFVPAEDTWTAMHGDRVVARIKSAQFTRRPEEGPEGRVIRILERANSTIVGRLQRTKRFFYVAPDNPRLVHDIYVQNPARRARVEDRVVVRLEPWESRHLNPEGEIIEVLGPADAPGVDILGIIRQYDLPEEFPRKVLAAAENVPVEVDPGEVKRRHDCRQTFIITIDPVDARDFDDAIHVRQTENGWQLQVHIADVAHYVRPGAALDKEARSRGNSVYLPDRVLPMLPERLSNGICSLRPEVERLTFAAFLEYDAQAELKRAEFKRCVIRSARRLHYDEALGLLEKPARDEVGERLHAAWRLAQKLRRRRFANGALDLEMPEAKVWIDDDGKPVRIEKVEHHIAHQLIEEFMLAANEAVAALFTRKLVPALYRVHENPDPEKLEEFRELARSHGFTGGDLTQRDEVQRLLARIRGAPEEHALKVAFLRSLKKARYDPEPIGHYGLALSNYTHFTSPIRRYCDLVVHRALAGWLARQQRQQRKREAPMPAQLSEIAEHISKTERVAADAERDAVRLKKLQFFAQQLEKKKPDVFDAIIMEVRNFGLFIELPEQLQTGLVHVSSLSGDFYSFDGARHTLRGRRTGKTFRLGGKMRVVVDSVDFLKQQVDFRPVDRALRARWEKARRRS